MNIHDVPVTLISSKDWQIYQELAAVEYDVSVYVCTQNIKLLNSVVSQKQISKREKLLSPCVCLCLFYKLM